MSKNKLRKINIYNINMDDPSFLPKEDAYEALYSKDKRRKKKRWTDGIAKVKISIKITLSS